jgi:hypothetical protein
MQNDENVLLNFKKGKELFFIGTMSNQKPTLKSMNTKMGVSKENHKTHQKGAGNKTTCLKPFTYHMKQIR